LASLQLALSRGRAYFRLELFLRIAEQLLRVFSGGNLLSKLELQLSHANFGTHARLVEASGVHAGLHVGRPVLGTLP
jgi:hypothetical protein